MTTTTRVTLLEKMSESIGDWFSGAASGNGAGDGTTVVDTDLKTLPGGADDDFCVDWFVRITQSGSNVGLIRRVSAYTASSGTITVSLAFAAQVSSGHTFELHRYDPEAKYNAIARALEELFPILYLPLTDESLVVDDILTNSDFETYSGGFTGWEARAHTGAADPTIAVETSRVVHGSQSAKITTISDETATGSGMQQNVFTSINIKEMNGKKLHFKGWAWASVGGNVRLRVTFDGSNFTHGEYHSGCADWEGPDKMTVSVDIPADSTQVMLGIHTAVPNSVSYVDNMFAYIDPIYKYTIPTSIINGPRRVLMQESMDEPNGVYLPLNGVVKPGHRLRLEGQGILTQPSTDAGTTEINSTQANLVTAEANRWLFWMLGMQSGTQDRNNLLQSSGLWESRAEKLKTQAGVRMRGLGADTHRKWTINADSDGRYMELKGR